MFHLNHYSIKMFFSNVTMHQLNYMWFPLFHTECAMQIGQPCECKSLLYMPSSVMFLIYFAQDVGISYRKLVHAKMYWNVVFAGSREKLTLSVSLLKPKACVSTHRVPSSCVGLRIYSPLGSCHILRTHKQHVFFSFLLPLSWPQQNMSAAGFEWLH